MMKDREAWRAAVHKESDETILAKCDFTDIIHISDCKEGKLSWITQTGPLKSPGHKSEELFLTGGSRWDATEKEVAETRSMRDVTPHGWRQAMWKA